MTRYCFYVFLFLAAANFLCSIKVIRELNASGIKVGYFEMRWQVHKHIKTYKQLTLKRDGQVSLTYYAYWTTLAGMAISGLLTLLTLKS